MTTNDTRRDIAGTTRVEVELPAVLEAHAPATITYRLSDEATGQALTDITDSHERPMHLIVVSNDLREFQHVHPAPTANAGEYRVDLAFPKEDRYMLFADFTRADGDPTIERETVRVGAAEATPQLTVGRGPVRAGSMLATLDAPEHIRAGEDAAFTVRFDAAALRQPVHDLQPYLGAAAHVIVLAAEGNGFAHAHGEAGGGPDPHAGHHGHGGAVQHAAPPERFGPEIAFRQTFPAPGLYKIWVQARAGDGTIVTPEFVVDVHA